MVHQVVTRTMQIWVEMHILGELSEALYLSLQAQLLQLVVKN